MVSGLDNHTREWYNYSIFYGGDAMAKKDFKKREDKLERTIMRNWIITGISLALIIILYFFGQAR